jgi:hypothetical protein
VADECTRFSAGARVSGSPYDARSSRAAKGSARASSARRRASSARRWSLAEESCAPAHTPLERLRAEAEEGGAAYIADALRELFGLDCEEDR